MMGKGHVGRMISQIRTASQTKACEIYRVQEDNTQRYLLDI